MPWAFNTPVGEAHIVWEPTGRPAGHTLVRSMVWAHCRKWVRHDPPGFPEGETEPVTFAYYQSKQITNANMLPQNPYDMSVDWAYWSLFNFTPGFGYVTDLLLEGAYEANIEGETHAQRKTTVYNAMGIVNYSVIAGVGNPTLQNYMVTGNGAIRQLWRHEGVEGERNPYAPTARITVSGYRDGELVEYQDYNVGAMMAPAGTVAEQEHPAVMGDPETQQLS